MSLIDDQELQVSCDQCGSEFTETVGDVKLKGYVVCPGCGDRSEVDEAWHQEIAAAEQKLLDFKSSIETDFGNLFKGGK